MTSQQRVFSPADHSPIETLNQHYFGGNLPQGFVTAFTNIPANQSDFYAYLDRTFRLLKQGGFEATDLSAMHGEVLGELLISLLPKPGDGNAPPVTLAGRHRKIDAYLDDNPWFCAQQPARMLDIGCGFPPLTTNETADYFPHWDIVGVDPSLPTYVVYDEDDNYATFDAHKNLLYFQPAVPGITSWNTLLRDVQQTEVHFKSLLVRLCSKAGLTQMWDTRCVELGETRLLINPTIQNQRRHLNFARAGIGATHLGEADVIRCFNVLMYFEDSFVTKAHEWFNQTLRESGILIRGANWANSTECRYSVYRKEKGQLKHKEFAFSIDNLCPIMHMPWSAMHDDDREIMRLANLLAVIRRDRDFLATLLKTNDELREEYEVCPRLEDGFYGKADPDMSPVELWSAAAEITHQLDQCGLTDHAVQVLCEAGYPARRNEVGHIAVAMTA